MPEQAARSSAARRAVATHTQDGERTRLADPARRTIVIRGQVADRYNTTPHSARSHRIPGSYDLWLRPERAALWAVLLGLALVIVALASAHI